MSSTSSTTKLDLMKCRKLSSSSSIRTQTDIQKVENLLQPHIRHNQLMSFNQQIFDEGGV